MALALIAVPLAFAALAFLWPSDRTRPWLLPAGAASHLALTALALERAEVVGPAGWLVLDDLGRLFLALLSVLFAVCAVYSLGYLASFPERSNRVFVAAMLAFLGTLSMVMLAHHLGLMWVALEATTLASAPLIYFRRDARSLEATWKYLLIGSVGVALALLGSFFLGYAALQGGASATLLLEDLLRDAHLLSRPWLHAAFVLLFVGYGTKMGLAPMHTWKPDAYGEAPGVVGTLLAGALTGGAFLAVLRFLRICAAAGDAAFAHRLLLAAGLFSMALAAVFMARQRDYKRMLAYSSIEHMGILAIGVGLGGGAVFGALLHAVNNGLTKGVLFLAAGNLHRAYGTKRTDEVFGALRKAPASAALLLIGFFAITGSPPFGPFLSEFTIVRAAFAQGRFAVGAAFLVMTVVVFVGMGATVLPMVQGTPKDGAVATRERATTVWPVALLAALVLLLGVAIPAPVSNLLTRASALVEAR